MTDSQVGYPLNFDYPDIQRISTIQTAVAQSLQSFLAPATLVVVHCGQGEGFFRRVPSYKEKVSWELIKEKSLY